MAVSGLEAPLEKKRPRLTGAEDIAIINMVLSIYYTSHYLRGAIAKRWRNLGAERSELGYPTTDETIWPDGRRVVSFEHGAIFWDGQDEPLVEIHAR